MTRNTDPKPTTYAEWEDLEEERDQLRADRDRLASELQATRAELEALRDQAHSIVANAWAVDTNILVYNAISAIHDHFGHQDCKRWVEFNVEHHEAGSVHVVLMKPGSKAEEIQIESQEEISRLRAELEETRHDLAKFQRSERVLGEALRDKTMELERVRLANRVLDSAAKDAQTWAYMLQQCRAELEIARAELVHQRDGYDHEPSEHAHGGTCRACKSEAALEKMDTIRSALASMETGRG